MHGKSIGCVRDVGESMLASGWSVEGEMTCYSQGRSSLGEQLRGKQINWLIKMNTDRGRVRSVVCRWWSTVIDPRKGGSWEVWNNTKREWTGWHRRREIGMWGSKSERGDVSISVYLSVSICVHDALIRPALLGPWLTSSMNRKWERAHHLHLCPSLSVPLLSLLLLLHYRPLLH